LQRTEVEPAAPIETETSGVRFPPPLAYIAGFLIGVVLEAIFPIGSLPLALALIGLAIGVVVWLALDGAAMLRFRRAKTSMIPMRPSTALVVGGPYRFSRNPMYVGMAFLYAGLALGLGVIWALVVLPAVLIVVDCQVIAREERYLERKFGDSYREYKARVRRWL
jgi:protein-S-isoprenylcysteine O-methyltransferase Ste14